MSGRTIEVVRAGALTTVQDLGRPGHAASGVPRGGAADPWAARAANRLVGNADTAALLEITLAGPTLRFHEATRISLIGDDFELSIDGEPQPLGQAHAMRAGQTLDVGHARRGVRAWLSIAGGIDVPLVLGSRSTELSAGFGGHEGRALRREDALSFFPSMEASSSSPSSFAFERTPTAAEGGSVVRVVPGPDAALLAGGVRALTERAWRMSPRSDRRGVRFEGEPLELAPHAPLRSQPMLPGAVELTSAGEPIVLGVDAPVTGGYPWVAQTIAADVGRLAHLAPGAELRFELVDFAAAVAALAERERELELALTVVSR
jgi:biotin-dependent carboxylase-like uncharacterized protein